MNKRNKLQISNAEANTTSLHTDSIILNPRLTAGHETPKTDGLFRTEPPATGRWASLRRLLHRARPGALYVALASTILYLVSRPSEYTLLIDEIYSLREQNLMLQNRLGPRNEAHIACGARAAALSPLYSYGFLRGAVSDPDSILEPTKDCMSLQGREGAFEVRMGRELRIVRVGIYHPATGNPGSAVHRFTVAIGGDRYAFAYGGSGYEEFRVDSTGDAVRWDVADNHGEARYTSVYRVYVYS